MMEKQIRSALKDRQEEVAQYQENIKVCLALIETLPDTWPEYLEPLRNETERHEAAAKIEKLEDVVLYSKLIMRDDLQKQIRAETFEMTRAQTILEKLEKDAHANGTAQRR